MIITISRQYGAGGSAVAARVAAELGWRVVDNELIDRVAAGAGLSPQEVAEREERAPSFGERLALALTRSAPELFPAAADTVPEPEEATLVRVTERVVEQVAAEGRVVLVGRAAPAVLRGSHDALHVKLIAPREVRLRAALDRLAAEPAKAEQVLQETDADRARYWKQHYGRDWEDASNYHMVLNTGALALEGATAVIVAEARRRWTSRL